MSDRPVTPVVQTSLCQQDTWSRLVSWSAMRGCHRSRSIASLHYRSPADPCQRGALEVMIYFHSDATSALLCHKEQKKQLKAPIACDFRTKYPLLETFLAFHFVKELASATSLCQTSSVPLWSLLCGWMSLSFSNLLSFSSLFVQWSKSALASESSMLL